jgi:hypothetical protein
MATAMEDIMATVMEDMATVVEDMAMVANTVKADMVVMVMGGRHKGDLYG